LGDVTAPRDPKPKTPGPATLAVWGGEAKPEGARRAMKRIASFVCGGLLSAGAVAAQEAAGPDDAAALLRRLEGAEARIKVLEQLAQQQSVQIAADQRRLSELLARTGKLEEEEAAEVATAPASPPGAVEAPPERPITHQMVSLTVNGLVQGWYAAGNAGLRDTFRIRRTEVYLDGRITNKARWQIMIDPAKALALETTAPSLDGLQPLAVSQSSRLLQNAVISFDYIPKVQVSVGQFKLPLSLEGRQSSGQLETVERALFLSDRARGGAYGDVRDIGLLLRGGLGSRIDIQAGLFNGVAETQNDVDRNDQKALAGSLTTRPWDDLQVGGSGAWSPGGRDRARRDRLGADLQLTRGRFVLKTEWMAGHDGPVSRRGYYGHVGWRLAPKVEAVLRVDSWDPDTRAESAPTNVRERDYVAGLSVLLSRHNLKVQANYFRKTFRNEIFPSRNVFLINTQTFW
jgi:phosphate-selective porin O/P